MIGKPCSVCITHCNCKMVINVRSSVEIDEHRLRRGKKHDKFGRDTILVIKDT